MSSEQDAARKLGAFNVGDSIGLLALVLTVIVFAVNPPAVLKAVFLVGGIAAFFCFREAFALDARLAAVDSICSSFRYWISAAAYRDSANPETMEGRSHRN